MKTEKRRTFIKKSMMASAGMAIGAPAYIKGFVQTKPSDMINVAVIGINSQGSGHIRNWGKMPGCRITAVCDCVEYLLPQASSQIEQLTGAKPKTYIDYRKLLEDKDVNVVSIATPGYWHAIMTINACQAGKDVYVEKPASYNIDEGRKMVQAARKYDRIVQVGTQHRSNRVTRKAIQLLQEGIIGDVYMGRGTVYRLRGSIGRKPDSEVPKGVNWDFFRGPAPIIPFNENHFLYNWHWYWDTSTSEFGNNGIHAMDRIRWGMNINEHPVKIACCGGFYAYDKESDQEIPNLEVATFEYANGAIMELEVRSLINPGEEYGGGLFWLGTKGYAMLGSDFRVFLTGSQPSQGTRQPAQQSGQDQRPAQSQRPAEGQMPAEGQVRPMRATREPSMTITTKDLPVDTKWDEYSKLGVGMHFVNFVDGVKSHNYKDLFSDIEIGHISTAQMHLGNIAYRTGRKLIFDGKTERFVNDKDADSYLSRPGGGRKPYNIPKEV